MNSKKKVLSLLLVLALVFCSFPLSVGASPVLGASTIAEIFPDQALAESVGTALGGQPTTYIPTASELAGITDFRVSPVYPTNGTLVNDFTGIEYLTGVINLEVDWYALDVQLPSGALQNMPNLESFTMQINEVGDCNW